ncbi:MAG: sensor domain-containing diguanylate cyclase [Anaerolineales bacterium]
MNPRTNGIIGGMNSQPPFNELLYRRMLENFYDGVCFIDLEGRVTYWNRGAERITGRRARQVYGLVIGSDLLRQYDEEGLPLKIEACPLLATLADAQTREAEVYLRHAEGYLLPVLVKTFPIHNPERQIVGAAEIFSDNPNLLRVRVREKSLEQTTAYDALTLIGNRKHLERKLQAAWWEFQHNGIPFGILFVDIDHFKTFNDTYGHNAGDKVLRAVANTLRHNLRETDTCGRWGGEEFLVIVHGMELPLLENIAEKLRLLVSQAIVEIDHQPHTVTISIGGTLARPGDTLESLVNRADKLMYRSKRAGRNHVSIG